MTPIQKYKEYIKRVNNLEFKVDKEFYPEDRSEKPIDDLVNEELFYYYCLECDDIIDMQLCDFISDCLISKSDSDESARDSANKVAGYIIDEIRQLRESPELTHTISADSDEVHNLNEYLKYTVDKDFNNLIVDFENEEIKKLEANLRPNALRYRASNTLKL